MQVVVQRSRVKTLLAVLVCAGFVVVSLYTLTVGTATSLLVGGSGVLTFGVFGVGWLVLLFRPGPGLVVDDEGFEDRGSGVAVGRVAWSDVTSVSEWGKFGSSHVVVKVRNPEHYLAQLGWLARLPARANRRMVGSPVTVTSAGLRISHSSLLTLLGDGYEMSRRSGALHSGPVRRVSHTDGAVSDSRSMLSAAEVVLEILFVVVAGWVLWVTVSAEHAQFEAASGGGRPGVMVIEGFRPSRGSDIPVGTFTEPDGTTTSAVAWQDRPASVGDTRVGVRVGDRAWGPGVRLGVWDVLVLGTVGGLFLWRALTLTRLLQTGLKGQPSQ